MNRESPRILAYPPAFAGVPHRRLSAGVFAGLMLAMVTAFAIAPNSLPPEHVSMHVVEALKPPSVTLAPSDEAVFWREERVEKNDTVAALLSRLGIRDEAAIDFVRNAPTARALSRQMRPGKLVSGETQANGRLLRLDFPLNSPDRWLTIERQGPGFVAREQDVAGDPQVVLRSGEIESSLFAATDTAGVPDPVAVQLAEIFAGEIDFHRDLRRGDRFSVVYEVMRNRGRNLRSGRVLAAEFVNAGRRMEAIWRAGDDGSGGYYDARGKSLRKAFLRSPLEFSRVTSGFAAARLHPVLKEWRAHRGVDYGAPAGTRVRATADGVVDVAGRAGGYGNLVVLRHVGGYSTAYGHLSAFSVRKGARVRQGDTIGFVGQTGLASGPHLHYEFRVHDQQVDPQKIALPEAPALDATALARFRMHADTALVQLQLAAQSGRTMLE